MTSTLSTAVTHLGQRGTLVIPAALRKEMGIDEGSLVLLQLVGGNLLIQPAKAVPVEIYTDERKAQFLLNNSADDQEYARARAAVVAMGLDPEKVPHLRPDED